MGRGMPCDKDRPTRILGPPAGRVNVGVPGEASSATLPAAPRRPGSQTQGWRGGSCGVKITHAPRAAWRGGPEQIPAPGRYQEALPALCPCPPDQSPARTVGSFSNGPELWLATRFPSPQRADAWIQGTWGILPPVCARGGLRNGQATQHPPLVKAGS